MSSFHLNEGTVRTMAILQGTTKIRQKKKVRIRKENNGPWFRKQHQQKLKEKESQKGPKYQ